MTSSSRLERLRLREGQIFLVLTIVIAVIAGLVAVLFTLAIQSAQHLFFGLSPSSARLILVPTLVSLGAGILLKYFFPEARGSGVPQTKAAFHLDNGRIRPIVPLGKFLTGVLCVGSGHSMGREGPSAQLGAGVASAIGQWFNLRPDRVRNLVLVGAAAALSAAFSTPVAAAFLNLPDKTTVFQPAIGGLLVGLILVFVPQVMGVGYEYVDQALNGGMALQMMLLLCGVKLLATTISYSSGNAGGIFAPSLYLGAMAGGVVGTIVNQWAPFPTAPPGAYALVGMGTLFAGIIRAPMTSVIMIFELTQDYKILPPLMIANVLSLTISRRFQPKPVYNALLEQNHIYLPETDARPDQTLWKARDIMTPHVEPLPEDTSFEEAWRQLQETQGPTLLVRASDRRLGSVHRKTVEHAVQSGSGRERLGSSVNMGIPYIHPDESLELALRRFDPAVGILPVVSRQGGRHLEGVITLDTILRFIHDAPADAKTR